MFWGITLENGKRYSQTVSSSFHVSMAALECAPQANKIADQTKKPNTVSLMIEHDKSEYLLCTLNSQAHPQQNLDLNFIEGEDVTFFHNGSGTVHLTGYLIEQSDMSDFEDAVMDGESESEAEAESPSRKRKSGNEFSDSPKKKKMNTSKFMAEEDFDSSDEDSDEIDDDDYLSLQKSFQDKSPGKKNLQSKAQNGKKPNDQMTSAKKEKKSAEMSAKKKSLNVSILSQNHDKTSPEKKVQQTPKTPLPETETPGLGGEGSKKKKKKKKRRNSQGTTVNSENDQSFEVATPKPSEKINVNTPKGSAVKKMGGTVVEELTAGSGPVAKPGKFVQIRYVGKLTNNRVFDASKGKPLGFNLGKGEVIKGMDVGIEGMKVGGKRKITIPPNQGYGNKKLDEIPANSTLIFEVELKSVS